MLNNDLDRLKKLIDACLAAFETLSKHKERLFPPEFSEEGEKALHDAVYRLKKIRENLQKGDLTSEALEQNGLNGPQLSIKMKAIEFFNKKLEKVFSKEDFKKLIQAVGIPLAGLSKIHPEMAFIGGLFELLDLLCLEAKDIKSTKKA